MRRWTQVPFGKHEGKTLPQIALSDPDWLFWAGEKDIFTTPGLKAEALEVIHKAYRIRIPQPDSMVEYVIHPGVGKLVDVVVTSIDALSVDFDGVREHWFDLSLPRLIHPYDKTGNKIMLRALKRYVFGNPKARLTKERCEAFFEDKNNFVEEGI